MDENACCRNERKKEMCISTETACQLEQKRWYPAASSAAVVAAAAVTAVLALVLAKLTATTSQLGKIIITIFPLIPPR